MGTESGFLKLHLECAGICMEMSPPRLRRVFRPIMERISFPAVRLCFLFRFTSPLDLANASCQRTRGFVFLYGALSQRARTIDATVLFFRGESLLFWIVGNIFRAHTVISSPPFVARVYSTALRFSELTFFAFSPFLVYTRACDSDCRSLARKNKHFAPYFQVFVSIYTRACTIMYQYYIESSDPDGSRSRALVHENLSAHIRTPARSVNNNNTGTCACMVRTNRYRSIKIIQQQTKYIARPPWCWLLAAIYRIFV